MKLKTIKTITLLLIIQAVFSILGCCEANSEKIANIYVSSTTANVGDEVSIEINLNNNSNFVSANLVLNYDTNHLEYISHTQGKILENGAMSIVKNNSEKGKLAIGYVSDPSDEDVMIEAGNILTVIFKITSDFEEETDLKLEATSLKDKNGADVTSKITNGKIKKTTNNKEEDKNSLQPDTKNEPKDELTNSYENSEAQTDIPKTGLSNGIIFIIIAILTSIILYYKNKSMKEIV